MANYLASQFEQIFSEVDAEPDKFGIESYRIRNMTLEQVFIAIGEEELKAD